MPRFAFRLSELSLRSAEGLPEKEGVALFPRLRLLTAAGPGRSPTDRRVGREPAGVVDVRRPPPGPVRVLVPARAVPSRRPRRLAPRRRWGAGAGAGSAGGRSRCPDHLPAGTDNRAGGGQPGTAGCAGRPDP